jgi:hypothetical protein
VNRLWRNFLAVMLLLLLHFLVVCDVAGIGHGSLYESMLGSRACMSTGVTAWRREIQHFHHVAGEAQGACLRDDASTFPFIEAGV